jgi:hypothetical protein
MGIKTISGCDCVSLAAHRRGIGVCAPARKETAVLIILLKYVLSIVLDLHYQILDRHNSQP